MKDKYGETIICMNCKKEIKDKKDLKFDDKIGVVYCKKCYQKKFNINTLQGMDNLTQQILGYRKKYTISQYENSKKNNYYLNVW